MVDPSSIDPNTVLGAGLMVLASKDMLNRLLGPTVDYFGGKVEGVVKKCDINLDRIFDYAVKRLGSRINEAGAVNPRVLKQVWSEGRFIEDELAAEYFGGLLASARTPDGKDDRVLSLLSTVRDLSVYDLRLHYRIYSLVRAKGVGSRLSLDAGAHRYQAMVRIPFHQYALVVGVRGEDDDAVREFAQQSLSVLEKYDLIGDYDTSPTCRIPRKELEAHPGAVISVSPSKYGTKLFLWAHGHFDKRIDQIFDPNVNLPSQMDVPTVPHDQ